MHTLFYLVLFLSVSSISCTDNGEPKFLGKLPITGADNIFFKVYQENKSESAVGIYYEIVDKQDHVLQGMEFLIGTSDFDRDNTKDFFTGVQDSIIYLSLITPYDVYAMYDLRSTGHCGDIPCEMSKKDSILINKLKKSNPDLRIQ